eukprot:6490861-Amphidinium_carterae.4
MDRRHPQKELEQQGTPVIQLDYSFLTDGEAQVPLSAAIDNVYHRTMTIWVPLKGADEYAVKSIRAFIQTLGFPGGIIQSDSELSALAVSKVAVEPIAGWSARQTPVNSKGSNHSMERSRDFTWTSRNVPDHQIMPGRAVQDEVAKTSPHTAMAAQTYILVERPIPS